jgi:hypothetical protein
VTTVPSQSVLGLPGFPVTLVRQANSSQVFLEQGGKLHWIFSAPVFHALGYHWSEVFAVKVLPLPLGLPITGASYPEFAPVVRGTLQWLASKNAPEAGAPAWIPPLPDARQADFISATASVSAQGWGVELHETRHPYGINYPSINASPHTHPFVGWGMNHMIPGQMGSAETAAGRLSLLESYSNLGPTHPPVTTAVSRRVNLGEGIMGQLYSNHTVLWHEGLWTMMVQGNSGAHDVAEAKPLVSYLHQNALPPYPGLIAVLQDTASADWLQGTSLYGIEGGQEPALSVLHMATSFQNVP